MAACTRRRGCAGSTANWRCGRSSRVIDTRLPTSRHSALLYWARIPERQFPDGLQHLARWFSDVSKRPTARAGGRGPFQLDSLDACCDQGALRHISRSNSCEYRGMGGYGTLAKEGSSMELPGGAVNVHPANNA